MNQDVLYTLAKVAVTLAGFSGVVVGLRLRGAPAWSATELRVLWLLVCDSFLVLFTTLGLYAMARHLLLGPAWRWFYVGCAAMGIGVITKGVGFLPVLL